MPRSLPPLNPLRSFEAAARHVSFTRAAEELGVTATAVSRQVSVLEGFLDRTLFERRNSELILTGAGAFYLAEVQPAIDAIMQATDQVMRRPRTRLLIRCERSLAMHWLAPRLLRYRSQMPDLAVELSTQVPKGLAEPAAGEIWIGDSLAAGEGVAEHLLFEDRVTPVCAPALLALQAAPFRVADLVRQPLLATLDHWHAWIEWLEAVGCDERPNPAFGFDDANLLFDAARRGLGFAIAPIALAEESLRDGSLVAPFPIVPRSAGFSLFYRPARNATPSRQFAQWLAEDAQVARPLPVLVADRAA